MKIKHKLLSDYQYTSADKKIFLIKGGTILENYIYKIKGEEILIDRAIIEANPQWFQLVDWKAELLTFMRSEKMPQPAQLGKKLIPFFEDMIMSSVHSHQISPSVDPALIKDVERRESELNIFKINLDRIETDLDSRNRRTKNKEDELEIRIQKIEKKEDEYKLDIQSLEKKENDLRSRTRVIAEKELRIQDKLQELNERERNLDRTALSSVKEIDSKYTELQSKIDSDLADLSKREKELEAGFKKIKELESNIDKITEANKGKIYSKGIEAEIRNIYNIVNTLSNFNHPVVIQVASELSIAVNRLKGRIDNNIID